MSLDSKDKYNILLLSVLFILVIIISIYVSFSRQKVHSFYDNFDLNLTEPLDLNSTTFNKEDENCTFCDDHDFGKYINQKFEESGLINYLDSQQDIEKPSLSEMPSFDNFNYSLNSTCTLIFPIEDTIKYSKNYKYIMGTNTIFYISEKFKGKLNEFYVSESISKINFDYGSYSVKMENYYLSNGECVISYYSTDLNKQGSQMECSGNYENFLCKEFLNELNYIGEDTYFIYGKNYNVYVYSSDDNLTILKYGKEIPVLFYLEQKEEYNKYLRIELLSVEEGVSVK